MSLTTESLIELCMKTSKEQFENVVKYEHLHSEYWMSSAYGLIETSTGDIHLLYFEIKPDRVCEATSLQVFFEDFKDIKRICERLIEAGRTSGQYEATE